jgi:hypothetical protein
MHVALAPCDQTAVVAGASSASLLYLQVSTSPSLTLLQTLSPAQSSSPSGVVYVSDAVVLVTDSTTGVDEYHLTKTQIYWYRRLYSGTGLTML